MYTLDIHVHVKVFSIDIVLVVFNIIYGNTCTHWIYNILDVYVHINVIHVV